MPHNGEPVVIRIGIHTGPCVSVDCGNCRLMWKRASVGGAYPLMKALLITYPAVVVVCR